MRIFFLFTALLLLSGLKSQENKYPFIQYDLSKLQFAKDSSSFMKFYQKLDSFSHKNKKVIRIAHIGGSHVQGGTWSNTFLEGLQTELKPSGGGYFVFPYRIAKTNSPHFASSFSNGNWKRCRAVGKEFCLPLGMSAMSITTNDSANTFGMISTKRSLFQGFNTIRVYHNFNPSFNFKISPGKNLNSVRIDNKEQGFSQFDLETTIDSISFDLVRIDSNVKDFVLYGFSIESNLVNSLHLATLGANGATSESFLRCNYFSEQLKSIPPDLVILSLGVNDTQSKDFKTEDYIEHYDSLIWKLKAVNPDVAILLTTTTDNFIRRKTANKRPVQAKEAMFELMNKHNIAVWDLYSVMGGYKSMLKWTKAGLAAKDRVHFSPKGYSILGNMMSEALLRSYHYNIKTEKQ